MISRKAPCRRPLFAHLCAVVSLLVLLFGNSVSAQVVINEVMANNKTVVANDGSFPQWVELHNPTGGPANISDWSISDSQNSPRKFIFPAGTVIPANGYLGIWLDAETNAPGIHTSFSVKARAGDDLTLYNVGTQMVDRVVFGIQADDVSIGRVPNGSGAWTLTAATFEFANQGIALGSAVTNNLRLNEVMANPGGGVEDWFEIYNATTNYLDIGGLVFTDLATGATNRFMNALSFIAPGGFLQLFASAPSSANPDADQLDFKLSNSAEQVSIYQANRTTLIDRLAYTTNQLSGVAFGRLPDGSTNVVPFAAGRATPEASNFQLITDVIINEVLTHTDPPLEDAIELYNPTANPVDISFWWLSNSKDDPKKFRIPANTVIPPNGYRVFYEWPADARGFNFNGQGTNRSFTLNSARGDQVYLHTADSTPAGNLTFFRLSRDFGPAENGVSFGRYVTSDGKTDFVPMSQHTFGVSAPSSQIQFRTGAGALNAYPKVGPMVITEIMYHPPDEVAGVDNSIDEYIELYNLGATTTLLYDSAFPTNTWRLRGVADFDFPQGVSVARGAYVLVVNFDPNTNATQLATFRSRFGVPAATPVFGPYRGKLQNGGGNVELYKPDPPQTRPPDVGLVPYVLVEKVKYSDTLPWPIEPDGSGSALQRLFPEQYGNDPANWISATATPGKAQAPGIQSVERAGNRTRLVFNSLANSGYTLQYQAALGSSGGGTGSNAWSKVRDLTPETTTRFRDAFDTNAAPRGFYRLVTPIQP